MWYHCRRRHDEFSLEIARKIYQFHTRWLLILYNECLIAPCFPQIWKPATAVCFPEERKERNDPSSFYSIYHLLALRKIWGKMYATHLRTWMLRKTHLETKRMLRKHIFLQCDFRKNVSMIDVLHNVLEYLGKSKRVKNSFLFYWVSRLLLTCVTNR